MTYAPPHEPVYHIHVAPSVPRLPPVTDNVVVDPVHIVDGNELADVAEVDPVLTITIVLIQVVVPHVPSALT